MKNPFVLVGLQGGKLSINGGFGNITLSYMRNEKLRDSFPSDGFYRVTRVRSGGVAVPIKSYSKHTSPIVAYYDDGYGQGICSTILNLLRIKVKPKQRRIIRVKIQKVKGRVK